MARAGWGRHNEVVNVGTYPDDDSYPVGTNEWNEPFHKGAGIFGFAAQTVVGHATTVVPNRSVVVLSGSTETGLFGLGDSEQYDVIWVFTSGSVVLTNRQTTPNADGQIVGLDTNATTITLSTTIPKIFIRRTVGSYDAWFEYGGGAASNLTVTNLAAGVLDTDITSVAGTDTTIPSAKATKAFAEARANHTGTQAASTISDFDAEVANNSAVTANTAKTGITGGQASAITANTAKTGITSGQASAIAANTALLDATAGTVSASNAVITDSSNNLTGFGNVTIGGNLTVSGTTTTINTATLSVEDPLIKLARSNTVDAIDIGFYGMHDSDSTAKYTGLFRDSNDSDKWKLFKELQVEPTTTVDVTGTGYAPATLVANLEGTVTTPAQPNITSVGILTSLEVSGRFEMDKGSDVVAAGTITMLGGGNTFDITGATTIHTITTTDWEAGSVIHLQFDAAPSITHTASGAGKIKLGDGAAMTTVAGDVLSLFFNGTEWVEISRSVVSSGGGMHEIQDFDLRTAAHITSYESSRTTGTDGYMFVREIDDENDGLFIKIKKNDTAWTEVQIA
jgi:hypothetical protein